MVNCVHGKAIWERCPACENESETGFIPADINTNIIVDSTHVNEITKFLYDQLKAKCKEMHQGPAVGVVAAINLCLRMLEAKHGNRNEAIKMMIEALPYFMQKGL